MAPLVRAMREYFCIIGKAKAAVSAAEIARAESLSAQIQRLLDALQTQWPFVNLHEKGERRKHYSLGNKFHNVFGHAVEFMKIWGCSAGWVNEESVEALNKILSILFKRYGNQRGCLRVKFAMSHLHVMTSAKYRKS